MMALLARALVCVPLASMAHAASRCVRVEACLVAKMGRAASVLVGGLAMIAPGCVIAAMARCVMMARWARAHARALMGFTVRAAS
jgi:hypothetical protein